MRRALLGITLSLVCACSAPGPTPTPSAAGLDATVPDPSDASSALDAPAGDSAADAAKAAGCTKDADCRAPTRCDVAICYQGACRTAPKVCAAPPEDPSFAACAPGKTFRVALGGACGGAACDPGTGACAYPTVEAPCPPAAAALPQRHPWQVVLRNFLAERRASDFDVTLGRYSLDPASLPDADAVHRAWLFFGNGGREVPSHEGLRVSSNEFLLSTIEATGGPYNANYRSGFIDPLVTALHTEWAYGGNPFRASKGGKLRAFVTASVDLLLRDARNEAGAMKQNHMLGAPLASYGYVYGATRDAVDGCTAAAFELGLRRMFQRALESDDDNNGNNDMGFFEHVGLHYAAQATRDLELLPAARAEARATFDNLMHAAGYFDHGTPAKKGGLDATYEGISLQFMSWAANASGWDFYPAFVERYSRLKARLMFPEPDGLGTFYGPFHFNPATGNHVALDQWASTARDVAVAMAAPSAEFLVSSGPESPAGGLPDEAKMRADLVEFIARANTTTTPDKPSPKSVKSFPWRSDSYYFATQLPTPVLAYRPGFHAEMLAKKASARAPFAADGDFVEAFGDELLTAKLGKVGVVLHTGQLSKSWDGFADPDSATGFVPAGFSGGALSAFYTEATGAVVLGMTRGTQGRRPAPDKWAELRTWPTHAVVGLTNAGGRYVSSALVRELARTYATTTSTAKVTVSGAISSTLDSGLSAPKGALKGDVAYGRTFDLGPGGLTIETRLGGDRSNTFSELYELLPIVQYDPYRQRTSAGPIANPTSVSFETSAGSFPADETFRAGVTAIVVRRWTGAVRIELTSPRRVRLAAPWMSSDFVGTDGVRRTEYLVRNVQIDLLDGASSVPLESVAVKYTLKPG